MTTYESHVRTSPSILTRETFERFEKVNSEKPTVAELQEEIANLKHEIEDLEGQRDRAVFFKQEAEKEVNKLWSDINSLPTDLASSLAKRAIEPDNYKLYPHYFREVPIHVRFVDVYWFLKNFEVINPCVQHAVKKLMAAGMRGAKNAEKDLNEAKDSITRALELEHSV